MNLLFFTFHMIQQTSQPANLIRSHEVATWSWPVHQEGEGKKLLKMFLMSLCIKLEILYIPIHATHHHELYGYGYAISFYLSSLRIICFCLYWIACMQKMKSLQDKRTDKRKDKYSYGLMNPINQNRQFKSELS